MDRVEDCISFLLGKAAQNVSRRARDGLAAHGVTPVQFATLVVLWEQDGLSSAELGARLVLDSATMTGIIDRLEASGAVERRPDPEGDRRVNRVHLTPAGRALKPELNAVMDAINEEVSATLGPADGLFRESLRRIGLVEAG